jgi:hypothetical protein
MKKQILIALIGFLPVLAEDVTVEVPDIKPHIHIATNTIDTATELEPINVVSWMLDATNTIYFTKEVKLLTNWVNISPMAGKQKGTVVNIQEMGTIYTNLVIQVAFKKRTNEVIIDVIGREEWPSQQRKRIVRVQ